MNFLPLVATAMRRLFLALPLAFVLSACSDSRLLSYGGDTNFLLFEHPNTEKASAEVRVRAEALCAQRQQPAIKTNSTCSLSKCTTSYQCAAKDDVVKSGL